ncbi:MAG: hypothetical protein FJX89_07815 [Bacteroidetes bacterium]|nr:hypothetical protein [Bacteroidota bacterium]
MDFNVVILIFLLGLRHGLDPDHITIIDNLSMRLTEKKSRIAYWTGTFFALGHGFTVTSMSLVINLGFSSLDLSQHAPTWLVWMPTLLLFVIGFLNLSSLLKNEKYQPVGWRSRFLKIPENINALSVFFVGVLFALVFDTATHLTALSYGALSSNAVWSSLFFGLIFTFGMVISDTVDGVLLYRISILGLSDKVVLRYRRIMGWIIVISSFTVAVYNILSTFYTKISLSTTASSTAGIMLVLLVAFIYIRIFMYLSKLKVQGGNKRFN